MKRFGFKKFFLLLIGISLIVTSSEGKSCTLFGAIGNAGEGGGVLIGKTRDRPKNLEQVFIEVNPKKGYRYRGISTKGTERVTSGINEKGLVVVSASASNLEKREGEITTASRILSKASSVEGVIEMAQRSEILGPVHFLVGDIHKIAILEVIDGNRNEILVKEGGTLYHTNHFILKKMEIFNPRIGSSSLVRLNRIESLLKEGPITKDEFIAFTKDHFNGPGNHSICRHFEAGTSSSERTVSAAVYYLSKYGTTEIWVALGQPFQSTFKKY